MAKLKPLTNPLGSGGPFEPISQRLNRKPLAQDVTGNATYKAKKAFGSKRGAGKKPKPVKISALPAGSGISRPGRVRSGI